MPTAVKSLERSFVAKPQQYMNCNQRQRQSGNRSDGARLEMKVRDLRVAHVRRPRLPRRMHQRLWDDGNELTRQRNAMRVRDTAADLSQGELQSRLGWSLIC